MKLLETSDRELKFARALRAMTGALAILDGLDAPSQVECHLDLAICRLEQHLGIDIPPEDGPAALHARLAAELLSLSTTGDSPCPWSEADVAQCQSETANVDVN